MMTENTWVNKEVEEHISCTLLYSFGTPFGKALPFVLMLLKSGFINPGQIS